MIVYLGMCEGDDFQDCFMVTFQRLAKRMRLNKADIARYVFSDLETANTNPSKIWNDVEKGRKISLNEAVKMAELVNYDLSDLIHKVYKDHDHCKPLTKKPANTPQ